MKRPAYPPDKPHGFTLAELGVWMGVVAIAGVLIVVAMAAGLRLFAKGTAINLAHQEARSAIERVCRDIRAAVSIPALVDTSRKVVDNTADAAGVAFSLQASPVLRVAKNANAGQNVIEIVTGTFVPQPGQRLIVPTHDIESDIVSVASGSTSTQKKLTLKTNLPVAVTVTNSGPDYNIMAFIADLVAYIAVNGELRYYPGIGSTSYSVLTNRLTNSTPFRVPSNEESGGSFTVDDNRFVMIQFKTADPTYSNLRFQNTEFELDALVSHNALLTDYRGFYTGSDRAPTTTTTTTTSAPPVTTTSPPTTTSYSRIGNYYGSRYGGSYGGYH